MKQDIYMVEVGTVTIEEAVEGYKRTLLDEKIMFVVDENVALFLTKEEAIKWGSNYVKKGVVGTYALLGKQVEDLDYIFDSEIEAIKNDGYSDYIEFDIGALKELIGMREV